MKEFILQHTEGGVHVPKGCSTMTERVLSDIQQAIGMAFAQEEKENYFRVRTQSAQHPSGAELVYGSHWVSFVLFSVPLWEEYH